MHKPSCIFWQEENINKETINCIKSIFQLRQCVHQSESWRVQSIENMLEENTFHRKRDWTSGNFSIIHLRKIRGRVNRLGDKKSHYQNLNPKIIKDELSTRATTVVLLLKHQDSLRINLMSYKVRPRNKSWLV